jgi:transaldolase
MRRLCFNFEEREMTMTKLHQAAELGQAIWLDFIRRGFIESGDLQSLIDDGLRGITSNPSIFEKAIAESSDYDDALADLVERGRSDHEIYEALAIEDIQRAADLLRPLYDETSGADGYVSLEANPDLAYDTGGTLAEVRHLFKAVDRPNVMIKVPATAAGIPAIATLIGEGINVNVTLMFSQADYEAVSDAYLRGLERLAANNGHLDRVASVASFFVSRVDTVVDEQLGQVISNGNDQAPLARKLRGAIGIINSKLTYARYLNVFSGERWQQLARRGARPQRLLWGSTSVKNPDYPDTHYVDNLMGASTVNTLPLGTIEAFRKHGTVSSGLTNQLDEARRQMVRLAELGIDLEVITQQLQDDGVTKFATAFQGLLDSIAEKRRQLKK